MVFRPIRHFYHSVNSRAAILVIDMIMGNDFVIVYDERVI